MTAPTHEPDCDAAAGLLEQWIAAKADESGLKWLRERRSELRNGGPEWKLFTSFSAVPRFLGKADLELSGDDLSRANEARFGWDPSGWSVDQAGRTLLILSHDASDPDRFVATLDKVFSSADVGESVALYQSLPVLPVPRRFTARASEGIRSNITSVFEAVALNNPYPAEYLDDDAWNQIVLKAVFVGSPLSRIRGLDERANPELARMLIDFARERRAAGRPVTPELWRPVGPFVDDGWAEDVGTALKSAQPVEREAAALALMSAPSQAARKLLDDHPQLKERVQAGELTWQSLGRE